MPGIYRRGGRYVVTFTDPSGRRRKRSAATMAEARALKSSLAANVARGDYREPSDVRITHSPEARRRSYELMAGAFGLPPRAGLPSEVGSAVR